MARVPILDENDKLPVSKLPSVFTGRVDNLETLTNTGRLSDSNQKSLIVSEGSKVFATVYTPQQFGGVGDGINDDTTAIQSAIDAASSVKGTVYLKATSSFYRISAPLVINSGGITVRGSSNRYSSIRQMTAATDCIQLKGDVDNDTFPGTLSNVVIEDLDIRNGAGGINSGIGINAAPVPITSGIEYNGNYLTLRRIRVRFFDTGLDMFRFDNTLLEQCSFRDGRIGAKFSGNANTIHAYSLMVGGSECGVILGDGQGSVLYLNDQTSNPRFIEVLNLARWSVIGGNMEGCTGTEFVMIRNGGTLDVKGLRFLRGSGNEVPGFRVENGGALMWSGGHYDGFTTSAAVIKESPNARVDILGQKRTTQAFMVAENSSGTELTRYPGHVASQNRLDNGSHTPDINSRGLWRRIFARDGQTKEDRITFDVRKADGSYEEIDLINGRAYSSANGGATAHSRRDGVKRYYGEVSFNTATATYTDVNVTIPVFTNALMYKTIATVALSGTGDVNPITVSKVSTTPGSGIVTFRVFHTSDTAGGKALKINYDIEVAN